ncbi:fatty acid desaturase family protein [Georgenia thermotolerans]|uniref:Acyl-CoA desaturase n=1 Tax=Georgenia thermotolerans TaxID=527326 RepID=A0A7J5UQR7_9MICO|nr:acyl-CoA desaturase [Georgenia thermotolerans]KAE8764679.1 acyl-CoA desaturase [Georgenia thermotolerans]
MSSTNESSTAPSATSAQSARERHVSDFTVLTQQVQAVGLMRRRYGYYWSKLVGLVVAGLLLTVGFVLIGDTWWQLLTAVVLAGLLVQISFLGHDAAHRQIFVSGRWNHWVSLVVSNLFAGIGLGWWQRKHNKHHATPNKIDGDPDIAPGIVAFTAQAAEARKTRLTRSLTGWQAWFFFPLLLLEGLNLHFQGMRRLLVRGEVKHRGVELVFLTVRLTGFVALVFYVLSPGKALAFIGVELAVYGLYLGVTFAVNHVGMPIVPADAKIDFLRRQVLMSRNIAGRRWLDTAMGGLNYQIEHHLFPSMARPNLRKVAPLIREYCDQLGVHYTETSLSRACREVAVYINRVGRGGIDVWACPLVTQYRT